MTAVDPVQLAWQAAHLHRGERCERADCQVYRAFTARVLAAHRVRSGSREISMLCQCGQLASACGVRAAARALALDEVPDSTR